MEAFFLKIKREKFNHFCQSKESNTIFILDFFAKQQMKLSGSSSNANRFSVYTEIANAWPAEVSKCIAILDNRFS